MKIFDIREATATLPPRTLIHGQEGVGKTTLAAKFPKPVFLLAEDGIPSGIKVAALGGWLENYASVQAGLVALANEPHKFQTVVVNSLDALEGLLWCDICASQGWQSIESPGYGKGYVAADVLWRDLLAGLDYLRRRRGMLIVLIAHAAIETVNDPRASSYTSYQLRLHKRARGIVQDWCDAIGFLRPICTSNQKTLASTRNAAALMVVCSAGCIGKADRRSPQRTVTACRQRCR